MNDTELLKAGRDQLLGLHKSLVDLERARHESRHGKLASGEFLNLLLESDEFEWLRKFSGLIVDIDEMFAQRDGFESGAVADHLVRLRQLVQLKETDEVFVLKYQAAIQDDLEVAARHAELRALLDELGS